MHVHVFTHFIVQYISTMQDTCSIIQLHGVYGTINSCNMGTSALPDMYARCPRAR